MVRVNLAQARYSSDGLTKLCNSNKIYFVDVVKKLESMQSRPKKS